MARSVQHARDCWYIIGKEYMVVHKFLDQFVGVFPVDGYGDLQRIFLHNTGGIHLSRIYYGDEAEKAAKIHIVRDWYGKSLEDKNMSWVEEKLSEALIYFEKLADTFGRRRDHYDLQLKEKK
jgi:hypothetical protein